MSSLRTRLIYWLSPKLRDEERAARLIAAEPPADFECQCGCRDFTAGGQTVRVSPAGARASGVVLSCLGCGARWYNTRAGLRKPHESALPSAWAMQDIQARAAKAQADSMAARLSRRQAEHSPVSRGPLAGFRVPPVPEGE
jgi:hypothetical protein